jgi:hypothetical protein|eukprot:COSAG06_NODE_1290_length_9985_cov_3.727190_7_plen_52_part_00
MLLLRRRGPLERDYIYTHTFYSTVNSKKMDHKGEMSKIYNKSLAPDPEENV